MNYFKKNRVIFFFLLSVPTLLSSVFFHIKAVAGEYDDVLLSIEEATILKKTNPRTIYIDVRTEDLFNKAHIPTSINIPLHFVKSKQYLKNMQVILVNEGYLLDPLYKEYSRLAHMGFNVHILAGGIAAWNQRGQELSGSSFLDELSLHIAPANSMLPGILSNNIKLFIDISATKQDEYFNGTVILPTANPKDADRLRSFIQAQDLDEKSAVLIFNQDGNYLFLKDLPSYCRPTLFFLEGGISEYQTALLNTQAMLQPQEKRRKSIGGCATCPPATDDNKDSK